MQPTAPVTPGTQRELGIVILPGTPQPRPMTKLPREPRT